jgi:hypothetical protein
MPNEKFIWMERIRAVEREFTATKFATERLLFAAQHDPTILEDRVEPREIVRAVSNLEDTYIIRLFAEFETALKMFLRANKIRVPNKAEFLVNRVAAKMKILYEPLQHVQAVREYRNSLVHDRTESPDRISLRNATAHLCTFFGRLPRSW